MRNLYPRHILLRQKNQGACGELTGAVDVLAVFVSAPGAPWTEEAIALRQQELRRALYDLQNDAGRYQVPLQLQLRFYTAAAERCHRLGDANQEAWVAQCVGSALQLTGTNPDVFHSAAWTAQHATLPGTENTGGYFTGKPLLLIQNFEALAFADPRTDQAAETAFLYAGQTAGMIRHELLHLFGAADLGTVPEMAQLTRAYFTDSVMLSAANTAPVDDVTAYLIGWLPNQSRAMRDYFSATAHLTEEDLLRPAPGGVTGFGDKGYEQSSFRGDLVDGMPHGCGRMTWQSGSVYTGEFEGGKCTGRGVLVWGEGSEQPGALYTGEFKDNVRTGYGTHVWPAKPGGEKETASLYTGEFKDGSCTGFGTCRHAGGNVFSGEMENCSPKGQGVRRWIDGSLDTGLFDGWKLQGVGTRTWGKDSAWAGNLYAGEFEADACAGLGTLRFTNGNLYTGEVAAAAPKGQGTRRWPDGTLDTGMFDGWKLQGEGMRVWGSKSAHAGHRYVGGFEDDLCHGWGVMHKPDGTTQVGWWEHGRYLGEKKP